MNSQVVTIEGRNDFLDAKLKTGLASPTWFVGLIDNAGLTNILTSDTAAKITATANPPTTNGWQEITAYDETTRVAWTPGTIASGSVDNTGSPATFTMNAPKTIAGAFLISDDTKGGTTGHLLGAFLALTPIAVTAGETVTVNMAPAFQDCSQ